jgi:hypothetical protein
MNATLTEVLAGLGTGATLAALFLIIRDRAKLSARRVSVNLSVGMRHVKIEGTFETAEEVTDLLQRLAEPAMKDLTDEREKIDYVVRAFSDAKRDCA